MCVDVCISDNTDLFDQEESIHQERLYLFQFPEPFPTFVSNAAHLSVPPLDVGTQGPSLSDTKHRRVSFAANVKVPESTPSATSPVGDATNQDTPKIDGIIGQLEVYRSGAVKMRLGNGILLNARLLLSTSFQHLLNSLAGFRSHPSIVLTARSPLGHGKQKATHCRRHQQTICSFTGP